MEVPSGPPRPKTPRAPSLRRRLLAAILLPVLAVIGFDTASLYRQALRAADTAYDRTLLASAKSIGERLVTRPDGAGGSQLVADVPYSALEAFETDHRSRLYFSVGDFGGRTVAGYDDLPPWRGRLPAQGAYAALVDFRDAVYRGEPVRMAVLLQPVAGTGGGGTATVQVAETLQLRRALAQRLLIDTLWRQALLVALIAAVVVAAVQWAVRPVLRLSAGLARRAASDLSPLDAPDSPRELRPLIDATDGVMARLSHLLDHQKRFVRDAAHQLRTPLAVLKVQVQSARRGDVGPAEALAEIAVTVDRATALADRMLALAKVEQLGRQDDAPPVAWDDVVREVALDVAPLMAERGLDFGLDTVPAAVRAHDWALRETVRNLLHNAVRHSPPGATLAVRLALDGDDAVLTVADEGPGIDAAQRARLFEPFAAGAGGGSGLGLAICRGIVASLGGRLSLDDRLRADGSVAGLDAVVRLPRAAPAAPAARATPGAPAAREARADAAPSPRPADNRR